MTNIEIKHNVRSTALAVIIIICVAFAVAATMHSCFTTLKAQKSFYQQ